MSTVIENNRANDQNERVKMVSTMTDERGAQTYIPERSLLGDNGAMIAWLGLIMHKAGVRQKIEDTRVNQKFRTDQVNVTWR